nr:MAG TPA: hypothetical protein [Caudoviricetes sp.]
MFNTYNPYYQNYVPQPQQRMDPQFMQPQSGPSSYKPPVGLQGKSVDSLEVVKAMDIPFDGSISYFPLLDGSAIVTKQLQQDGTSKMIVYKPAENEAEEQLPKYVTEEDLKNAIKNVDIKDMRDLKEDMKNVKRQLRDLIDDMNDKKEV